MAIAFFRRVGPSRFLALEHAVGPWSADHLHAGPPTALLNRVAGELGSAFPTRRMTVELRAPVPLAELTTQAEVLHTSRNVERVRVTLHSGERLFAEGLVLKVREEPLEGLPDRAEGAPPEFPFPDASEPFEFPFFRTEVGYHTAMDLRIARGTWGEGPVTGWMRMRGVLLEGEASHPLDPVFAAADSGNGLSPVLDPATHLFVNADLSVHVATAPADGWVALDAKTTIDAQGTGVAHSTLWSTRGPLGAAAQTLVVRPRSSSRR